MSPMQCKRLALTLLLILTCAIGGCSSFDKEWQAIAAEKANAGPGDGHRGPYEFAEGRWVGRWHSDWNGHSGKLRAIVTPIDGYRVRARFHATYAKALTFEYTATLNSVLDMTGDHPRMKVKGV